MKITILPGILSILLTLPCFGVSLADDRDTVTASAIFSSNVYSRYVGDTGIVYYDRPVIQNELIIPLLKGFYLDLWVSTSLDHAGLNTNDGNEFDPALGWAGDIGDLSVDMGMMVVDVCPVGTFAVEDGWQPYVEISRTFSGDEVLSVTGYGKAEYGFPVKGDAAGQKGVHLHFGARPEYQVNETFRIATQVELAFDDNAFGYGRTWVFDGTATLSYSLTDRLTFSAGGGMYVPFKGTESNRSTEFIGVAGFEAAL